MLRRTHQRLRQSVRIRLLLGGLLILTPISVGFGMWGLQTQHRVLLETIDRQGRALADAMAISCVEPLLERDYPILDSFVETLTAAKDTVMFARIEDSHGRVVSSARAPNADTASTTVHSAPIVPIPGAKPIGKVILGLSTEPASIALSNSAKMQWIETVAAFLALAAGLSWLFHPSLAGKR